MLRVLLEAWNMLPAALSASGAELWICWKLFLSQFLLTMFAVGNGQGRFCMYCDKTRSLPSICTKILRKTGLIPKYPSYPTIHHASKYQIFFLSDSFIVYHNTHTWTQRRSQRDHEVDFASLLINTQGNGDNPSYFRIMFVFSKMPGREYAPLAMTNTTPRFIFLTRWVRFRGEIFQ